MIEIIKEIEEKVLKMYPKVTAEELKLPSRYRRNYEPRNFICMYARDMGVTVQALGDYFNRDHSTISVNTNNFYEAVRCNQSLKLIHTKIKQSFICEHEYITYSCDDKYIKVCNKCNKLIRL